MSQVDATILGSAYRAMESHFVEATNIGSYRFEDLRQQHEEPSSDQVVQIR